MFPVGGTINAKIRRLAATVVLLYGCTSSDIYNDPDFNPPVYWGSHVVRPGDTLFAIAWRYGRDPRDIALANGLTPPYKIVPGQRLTLVPAPEGLTEKPSGSQKSESLSASSSPVLDRPSSAPAKTKGLVAGGAKKVAPGSSGKGDYKKKQKPADPVTRAPGSSPPRWQWPHPGPIIDTFSVSGKINKGIDIAGKIGDPVVAAADGEVVYAGSGLIGYGLLVIINHDDEFLSAYAHNHQLLVREGSVVTRGMKIAEMGNQGTNRPKLHFEIRRNGQPVDPRSHLPKR